MFNISGTELVVILMIALVVLGPDKLPDAMRRAGKAYAELRKMTSTFQSEMRSALDEPVREMRETADLLRQSAQFDADRPSATPTLPATAATSATPAPSVPPEEAATSGSSRPGDAVEPSVPTDGGDGDRRARPAEQETPPDQHREDGATGS